MLSEFSDYEKKTFNIIQNEKQISKNQPVHRSMHEWKISNS